MTSIHEPAFYDALTKVPRVCSFFPPPFGKVSGLRTLLFLRYSKSLRCPVSIKECSCKFVILNELAVFNGDVSRWWSVKSREIGLENFV